MKAKRKTQMQNILAHLERGWAITPMVALKEYGCFRLSSIIFQLKKAGHNIESHRKHGYSTYYMEEYAAIWRTK
jgi:biotin operon repressor